MMRAGIVVTTFRRLVLATTVTTLGVIAVGGLVRATGSGDGCPDWPRCFGRWIPPLEYHALIEYSHRSIGAVAIGLLCLTTVVAFRRHRSDRRIVVPMAIATFTIFMQAGLGAIVVAVKTNPRLFHLESAFVTFHIATAMLLIAMLVAVTVRAYTAGRVDARAPDPGVAILARASAAGIFALIGLGAYVRGAHASLVFLDWPLMGGRLIPTLEGPAAIHFSHRFAAALVGVLVAAFIVAALRSAHRTPAMTVLAVSAGVLYLAQVIVGGLQVLTRLAAPPVVAHVALSASIWAALLAAVSLSGRVSVREALRARRAPRAQPAPVSGGQLGGPAAIGLPVVRSNARAVISAYVQLTKPRIIVLLLITTVPSMMLAAGGLPSVWLVLATLAGGTLAAGAANTLNCYVDRDIDAVMRRTRSRPIPSHRVAAERALAFGLALQVASFVLMVSTVNLAAALLAQAALVFYVFVYTIALKRTTPQNIVIGGAAGAVPCLVGWAAVTGAVGWEAVVLFAIVFLWTPPHFWALAMRYADDYQAAGVPMLPVVRGREATLRQIVGYTLATVAASVALWAVAGMGPLYLAAALALGGWFTRDALRLRRDDGARAAMTLFKTSISYLALLFAAVAVDAMLAAPA